MSFNRAGELLSAGVGDGTVWLWDIATPSRSKTVCDVDRLPGRVNDAQFAGATDLIAGSGSDKTVRVWAIDPDSVVARICRTAGCSITEAEWERYLPGVPYRDPCDASTSVSSSRPRPPVSLPVRFRCRSSPVHRS